MFMIRNIEEDYCEFCRAGLSLSIGSVWLWNSAFLVECLLVPDSIRSAGEIIKTAQGFRGSRLPETPKPLN